MAHHSTKKGSWGTKRDTHQSVQHNNAKAKPFWVDQGKKTNSDRNKGRK